MANQDLLNMSDEDIANMSSPPENDVQEGQQELDLVDENQEEETNKEVESNVDETKPDDDTNQTYNSPDDESESSITKSTEGTTSNEPEDEKGVVEDNKPNDAQGDSGKKEEDQVKPEASEQEAKSKSVEPLNYETLYKQIMAPFKANGKEIKLNSPDEVKQLMQMGANYTKKLQSFQPNLKMMKMLENNGLMDESKLSFLIDVSKKNPEAIKKLLKDSNIDPMDIDTNVESKYQPSNYRVSDEQMRFDNTLNEVAADPEGGRVLIDIRKDWDEASIDVVRKDPSILSVMAQQKAAGIYDQISSEVERQKLLGNLNGVSYITAYHQVGQALQQQGLLRTPQSQGTQQAQQTPRVVEQPAPKQETQSPEILDRRPATRPPADPNSERARATTPVRTGNKPSTQDFNPLSMSDEEFAKSVGMAGRFLNETL